MSDDADVFRRRVQEFIQELRDLGTLWREQMAEVTRAAAEAASRAATPTINIGDVVGRLLEQAQAEFVRQVKEVQEAAFGSHLTPEVQERLRQVQQAFDQAHVYYGEIVTALGEKGWYVDVARMTHPDVSDAVKMFEAGETEKAHEALCDWFEEQMDDIEDGLKKAFPQRARHIGQALAAHRRREYALSIPVFLLEADGICQEEVEAEAYGREKANRGQRAIANAIRARAGDDPFVLAMCAALMSVKQPLVYGRGERAQHGMADAVNRHAVLHGEDLNYDTRRNSCQALSFLAHVASVLPDLKAKTSATP